MPFIRTFRLTGVVLGTILALVASLPAQAQLDPGNFDLYQNGMKVGEVYVPSHLSTSSYVEHY
jgi:hypothetical protein